MNIRIAQDLRAARQKAGLTQRDLSILLELGGDEVTALEAGQTTPSIEQLCRLSIIYNRSFSGPYQEMMQEARQALFRNLPDLPDHVQDEANHFNRDNTLKRLQHHLSTAIAGDHDGT